MTYSMLPEATSKLLQSYFKATSKLLQSYAQSRRTGPPRSLRNRRCCCGPPPHPHLQERSPAPRRHLERPRATESTRDPLNQSYLYQNMARGDEKKKEKDGEEEGEEKGKNGMARLRLARSSEARRRGRRASLGANLPIFAEIFAEIATAPMLPGPCRRDIRRDCPAGLPVAERDPPLR